MPYWSPTGVCSLKTARWRNTYPVPRTGAAIDYADITITVVDDVASADDVATFSWDVWEGGPGAPDGKLRVTNDIAYFTYNGVDYAFTVAEGGTGGVTFTVTNDVGSITVGSTDYQWQVYEV